MSSSAYVVLGVALVLITAAFACAPQRPAAGPPPATSVVPPQINVAIGPLPSPSPRIFGPMPSPAVSPAASPSPSPMLQPTLPRIDPPTPTPGT